MSTQSTRTTVCSTTGGNGKKGLSGGNGRPFKGTTPSPGSTPVRSTFVGAVVRKKSMPGNCGGVNRSWQENRDQNHSKEQARLHSLHAYSSRGYSEGEFAAVYRLHFA